MTAESHCLPGQNDKTEEWELLTECSLETSVKLRILPELTKASQMSAHIMDEMSQAAVNGENSQYDRHELCTRYTLQPSNECAVCC